MKEVWRELGDSKYNNSYIKIKISLYLESSILFIKREHLCSQLGVIPVQNFAPMVQFPCKSKFCVLPKSD